MEPCFLSIVHKVQQGHDSEGNLLAHNFSAGFGEVGPGFN